MRILYFARNYKPMTASSITTYEIIKKLVERGHEITLLAPRRCPEKCTRECSLRCKSDVRITVTWISTLIPYYIVNQNRGLRTLALSLSQFLSILKGIKICRKEKIDVIVSQHHASHFATFSAFMVSRMVKLPLIIKIHDVYNSASNALMYLLLRALDSIHHIIFRRAEAILVFSNPIKLSIIQTYDLDKDRVVVFPNCVDLKQFKPSIGCGSLRRDLQIGNRKVIMFVGGIHELVGLSLLIQALPEIVLENSNVMALFVGDGPQKPHLKKLAQELNVEEHVRFVDPMDHSEIPKYVCMSDVTIGPLVATIDSFGVVPRKVLEYMACAKPVIVCRGGVSSDLIIDGYNGFVFDSKATELADITSQIIENPELARKVGHNARKHVETFHDWEKVIGTFEEVGRVISQRCEISER